MIQPESDPTSGCKRRRPGPRREPFRRGGLRLAPSGAGERCCPGPQRGHFPLSGEQRGEPPFLAGPGPAWEAEARPLGLPAVRPGTGPCPSACPRCLFHRPQLSEAVRGTLAAGTHAGGQLCLDRGGTQVRLGSICVGQGGGQAAADRRGRPQKSTERAPQDQAGSPPRDRCARPPGQDLSCTHTPWSSQTVTQLSRHRHC